MSRWWAACVVAAICGGGIARARADASLAELSLQELSNLQVTSVSKSAELLREAPASIYVITHDDILRAGVTSVAEALRLAPNLQVLQYTASNFVAGARGFAGAQDVQNFSNKLLILIDGRSVYSPLYSGVYLDVQDVLLDDVDRIEVISGAGATLWGANAMHGVINIITRPAYLSDAPLVHAAAGTQERDIEGRLGRRVDESFAWRAYAKAFERDPNVRQGGLAGEDGWHKGQAGFRMDWTAADDTVTLQGDGYHGRVDELGVDGAGLRGANVLGRWQHRQGAGEWQLQAYYDHTARSEPAGGVAFGLDTYDIEAQQRWVRGRHRLIGGAGVRVNAFDITNAAALAFEPSNRTLTQANLFVQDTIALGRTELTAGAKGERDSYGGWHLLPDVRLAWRVREDTMGWLAASRAIRSPTPFDRDVVEKLGGTVFVVGKDDFAAETVDAIELGMRTQPSDVLSLSLSTFLNHYDDLRTIEPASPAVFLPLHWDNLMGGRTYGAEAWAKWQVASWWRLSPGVRWLQKDLHFAPGSSGLLTLDQSGNDPKWQALLNSSMEFGPAWRLELNLRHVATLPSPHLDAWQELDANLLWRATPALDIALTGRNLLDRLHEEYPAPGGVWVRRAVLAQLRWHPGP